MDKISLKTKLLVSNPSEKVGPTLVPTPHTSIHPIQNNSPTSSSLPSLSYKSTFSLPTPRVKKPIVEIKKNDDIDSDIEIQPPSP